MAEDIGAGSIVTDRHPARRPLRVAVVGSGPAGVYAAQALLDSERELSVDVLDRLPTPFGLVRYGVAPDHPKIKSIGRVLARVLGSPRVRFLGNVHYGVDLDETDLQRHYDAVVHASGCSQDRKMGLPGEDLPGSTSAATFIDWYNGHPDGPAQFALDAHQVAVVGAGNVALDAARMLVTRLSELHRTDVPDGVLAAYRDNRVSDVYLFARRGPEFAKFTTPELREMAVLPEVDVLVDPADLPPEDEDVQYERTVRNNLATLRAWAEREPTGAPRRVHLCFWSRPREIRGAAAVEAIEVERTVLADGRVTGTGQCRTVPVQAVLRAVGYSVAPVCGLPFDKATGSIPHEAGRVVGDADNPVPGVYVAGWIKRGPVGVIGTNKHDAVETVRTLLADADDGELPLAAEPDPEAVTTLLTDRGVRHTSWDGWLSLELHERRAGERQQRPAAKVAERDMMLKLSGATESLVPADGTPEQPSD